MRKYTVILPDDGELDLDVAQAILGGYVEAITVQEDGAHKAALINEDGLRLKLAHNAEASAVAGYGIVGPMIILECPF